jgi:hypothetical protein
MTDAHVERVGEAIRRVRAHAGGEKSAPVADERYGGRTIRSDEAAPTVPDIDR